MIEQHSGAVFSANCSIIERAHTRTHTWKTTHSASITILHAIGGFLYAFISVMSALFSASAREAAAAAAAKKWGETNHKGGGYMVGW